MKELFPKINIIRLDIEKDDECTILLGDINLPNDTMVEYDILFSFVSDPRNKEQERLSNIVSYRNSQLLKLKWIDSEEIYLRKTTKIKFNVADEVFKFEDTEHIHLVTNGEISSPILQDHRIFHALKNSHIELHAPTFNKLEASLKKSMFSDLLFCQNEHSNCYFFFDLIAAFKQTSELAYLLENPVFVNKFTDRIRTTKLHILVYKKKCSKTPEMNLLQLSDIKRNEYWDIVYDREQESKEELKELFFVYGPGIRSYMLVGPNTVGSFKYKIEINFTDEITNLVLSILDELEKDLSILKETLCVLEIPNAIDKNGFPTIATTNYVNGINLDDILSRFILNYLSLNGKINFTFNDIYSLIDPNKINQNSLSELIDLFEDVIFQTYAQLDKSAFNPFTGKYASTILNVSHEFMPIQISDINCGIKLLDSKKINESDLRSRLTSEYKKYFNDSINSPVGYSFLTPKEIFYDNIVKSQLLPSNIFDYQTYNELLSNILLRTLNNSHKNRVLMLLAAKNITTIHEIDFQAANERAQNNSDNGIPVKNYTGTFGNVAQNPKNLQVSFFESNDNSNEEETVESDSKISYADFLMKLLILSYFNDNLLRKSKFTISNQEISELPIQLRALSAGHADDPTSKFKFSKDLMLDGDKFFAFWSNYKNIFRIEVLTRFGRGMKDMNWETYTPDLLNAPGDYVCRFSRYTNESFGVKEVELLNLPIYDKYFILTKE